MVLDVPDVDDLVLQGRHLVPGEPALGGGEIQRVDAAVDHLVADAPVLEQLVARVGVARLRWAWGVAGNGVEENRFFAMMSPRRERVLVLLQIEVGVEQRVVGDAQNGTAESAVSFQCSSGHFSIAWRRVLRAA